MSQPAIRNLRHKLLAWYGTNARRLPWRETRDPYRIWISEIMLQQTQVDTVIPYYRKWIRAFPTVRRLAAAELGEVLHHWAGLGYYRRARMIHEASRKITDEFNGRMPKTAEDLLKLPGIGRYSAGAIASIACGEAVPVVDGNVIRILTRLFAIRHDIGLKQTQDHLWHRAAELVPQERPGDFNQAMMELGALVCLPQNPGCLICPVSSECQALAEGSPTRYPVRKDRVRLEKKETAAMIFRNDKNRILIKKQPEGGRWGGLWMFPHWDSRREMEQQLGRRLGRQKPFMQVRHGFTRYQITLNVYENTDSPASVCGRSRWVALDHLEKYAFPSPHQKIVRELLEHA